MSPTTTDRLVYFFGNGHADGDGQMRERLGGKGAGLAEMTRIGIPVPPGFTIASSLCLDYLKTRQIPGQLRSEMDTALAQLEQACGKQFGGETNPLLVSVRSGAAVSMPGMMETILNLGLNDRTVAALARLSGNEQFAWDSYRRFVSMYGGVVYDLPKHTFDELLDAAKHEAGVERDIDLPADRMKKLVGAFKQRIEQAVGHLFPDDPREQLWGAIAAVFESWNIRRAVDYRRLHGIPDTMGTAVNVVAMVYGNLGDDSGTGVAFTRNPSTGERRLFGEFLLNAQGEDVVAGIRTPVDISGLADALPPAAAELERVARLLEQHYRDMQDMEFTVERGTLYMLQTRRGQRTGQAAVRIAVEMAGEGLISEDEAVGRVPPDDLNQLLHPTIDTSAALDLLATGLPASPGAASGAAVFDADRAEARGKDGEAVILVRRETSPEDFHGMVAARAVLTARGGMTSHAAVVARGMGKPCVVGATTLEVDEGGSRFAVNGRSIQEGDWITLDGATGKIYAGRAALREPELSDNFRKLMGWADRIRGLKVRCNADTPDDARRGREFGSEGIGLCRTEHMFFDGGRLSAMREMIVATDLEGRTRALEKLLPMQRADFEGIFRAMDGLPVCIRLLDPPLHEFLPHEGPEIDALAKEMAIEPARLHRIVAGLTEVNPMLGLRGCRLGILFPEITAMQARAIFEAACAVTAAGVNAIPEVMIPLIGNVIEFRKQAALVREVAAKVFAEAGRTVAYTVGTMIELPRAALTADAIAKEAEFFSFGTNDLTQTTWGLSRDDAGRILPLYLEQGIIEHDPFQVLDQTGVGALVRQGVELGRSSRPDLKVGICGEHGGEPASVGFCDRVGMNYVSCSPFRVPIARLAAAQASLQRKGTEAGARTTV
jgi:pyruvate,orthophosphate dikinase